jgi:hypothetical protein
MRHRPWRAIFLVGGTVVAILLLILAAPCERDNCLLPDEAVGTHASAQSASPVSALPDYPLHCGLHCGLLVVHLLIVSAFPALLVRLRLRAPDAHLLLTAPPLLPPPQTA